ncbi:MAG: alkaline phosphatase family protein, partial [Gemmatimonadaceae bacterium]|nr:alkaline phosphatase family protein [Gemmatimonadaceae bacterium]
MRRSVDKTGFHKGAATDDRFASGLTERRAQPRAGPALRLYYRLKYRAFAREKRAYDGRRGLIALQIDALAHADLLRAIELGRCPTIANLIANGSSLRPWFCGLPAATPYCQAGIFHGENDGIPAFRFYDRVERRIVTCNAPEGVQYIRDRIASPGALAGGSSYVNLLDGDAQTVAFTVATREKMSVYKRLGGTRMALLMALHPIRMARMVFQGAFEWLLEEWERLRGEISGTVTHAEGIFPFIRILSNVVVRELQTMAILLDIYLGVPIIYSTFMQYDELAHHFGPSSKQAIWDLKRTDARISEIVRMVRVGAGRRYDIVILSDHGMTPAKSYRVKFKESLGATVERMLRTPAPAEAGPTLHSHASFSEDSEYADVGPGVLEAAAQLTPPHSRRRRSLQHVRDWVRSRYGLREIIFPEKYRVNASNDVVVTYSSCLALVYFAESVARVTLERIRETPVWNALYDSLRKHEGIGLVGCLSESGVHCAGRDGFAVIAGGVLVAGEGINPLAKYGDDRETLAAIEALVRQQNAGDCVLFGEYDGNEIISFDDQVGAHGS